MQPVIRFENVGKLYRLGTVGTGTLSHDLRRWWITSVMRREDPYLKIGETNDRSTKGSSDYVYALRDINLEIQEGDVLGIIGKNGAGKSTLLKLLSRVTAPTTGKIYTRGRIASLLEVGTGFHPELTGRENIYMNGCILGMKRHEIDKKLDEIVDFSGCERYIDTPVKRYSSGMMVRLGFAVAAHLDPEILVVDEVLAVGDAEFQKKAIGKMQDVSKGQGRTVLFVSHNMGSISNLCSRCALFENGFIKYDGLTEKAISLYKNINTQTQTCVIIDSSKHSNYSKEIVIKSIRFANHNRVFKSDDTIPFIVELYANKTIENCRVNLTISSADGTPIGSVSSLYSFSINKNQIKRILFSIHNHNLAEGVYFTSFSVGIGNYTTHQRDFDAALNVLSFEINGINEIDSKIHTAQWESYWGHIMFQYSQLQID